MELQKLIVRNEENKSWHDLDVSPDVFLYPGTHVNQVVWSGHSNKWIPMPGRYVVSDDGQLIHLDD